MTSTIYVVTWIPQSVGGFEWRTDRASAELFAKSLQDPTAEVHEVAVPDEVGTSSEAITSWLDSEGWSDGGDPRTDVPAELIGTVTDHYLTAGLWADAIDDNGHEVTDAHDRWEPSDVACRDRATEHVAAFLAEVRPSPEAWAVIIANPEQAGHDLWLSAGGHGAGFWDRGHGLTGDYLHTAAQMIGSAHIFVSDGGPWYEAG